MHPSINQAALQTAAVDYHTQFRVPHTMPICHEAINRYAAGGQITIAFHTYDETPGSVEIATLCTPRIILSTAAKRSIAAQYRAIPSTLLGMIEWPAAYPHDQDTKELISKLISVVAVRWRKMQQRKLSLSEAEPQDIAEYTLLLNLFPDICYMAVAFGPHVPDTILQSLERIYIVTDTNRAPTMN